MADKMDQGEFGPSDKEKKYDRQLRLWAASGQAALESAHLLLVNSGAGTVGVETLKNLVLPGIGQFTIADDAVVNTADLGVNFFLDESSLGTSRARACTDFLLELNPEVKGNSFSASEKGSALNQALSQGHRYTAILYTLPLAPEAIEQVQSYSREHCVPLIAIHCVGYYAYFRVGLPGPFPVVDTHPEQTATEDLRLLTPWPELSEFAASMTSDIDNLDAHKHGHIPLVVILLHYIELWKKQHDGNPPTKYADKIAFRKAIIDAMRKDNAEGGEENFEEAAAAVMKHVVEPQLPPSLREIFEFDHSKDTLNKSFWIISDALKAFYQTNQRLPVSGGLPDMKAESNVYIQLQNIYKTKARQDAAEILEAVQKVPGGEAITKEEVDLFCANARFAKLINANANAVQLGEEVERQLGNDEIAAVAGPEMPLSLLPIYLALNATSHQTTASAAEIQNFVINKAARYKDNERAMKIAEEVARSAGGELHNISAAVGGMVAQELIKVITQQYIAIDNTCIYDGIESRCQILRL